MKSIEDLTSRISAHNLVWNLIGAYLTSPVENYTTVDVDRNAEANGANS